MRPLNNNSKYNQAILSISDLKNPEKYVGKIKDNIVARSSYELAFMKYCDTNPNILEWKSEENVIIYKHPIDNRPHRYFMDFWIKVKQKSGAVRNILVEVKPYSKTVQPVLTEKQQEKTKRRLVEEWAINSAKWKAAQKYAQKYNMLFKIITEKDLYFSKKR